MPSTQIEQMKQTQQSSAYPVTNGGNYSSPPPMPTLPIQTHSASGSSQQKGVIVNLGKISLSGIFFSLIIMGALTFLSGFLLGIWFASPTAPIGEVAYPFLSQTQNPQHFQTTPTSTTSAANQAIQTAAGQAGFATQSVVSNIHVPNVPSFLAPLVSATQSAVGQQLGYKAQQQVNRGFDQGLPLSAPATPQQKPTTQTPPLTQPAPSSYPAAQPPQPQNQISAPSPSPTSQQSAPKSQSQKENFSIQLGAYASKENAHALVNHLQALNINSQTIVGKGPEGNTVYYVHSGLYNDYNQALEAASQFANQNLPGAMVVSVSEENKSAS